jgi:hypothetical protein
MRFQLGRDASLTVHIHDSHRCQFGITEALGGVTAALGGGDLLGSLGSLFGIGSAAAAPAAETGLATIGADAAGLGADAGLAGITGTGTALAGGGATGLAGTALAGGSGLTGDALLGAGAGGALGSLGAAQSFIDSPLASGFNPAALTGGIDAPVAGTSAAGAVPGSADVFGGTPSATAGVANVGPATSSPITGLNSAVGPAGPAAPSAAVAPSGAGATDLTSGFGGAASGTDGTVPGASGPTSLNGNPVSGGSGNILDNAVNSITKNPLSLVGPAAGLGGLAYTITQANKQLPEQTTLNTAAQTATANGNQLSSYLLNGTLPAGLQTTLDKATADAKTAAISNAAKNGQPTDPSQNSTLAAELAQIDQQATISTAQIGQSLLTSGLSETQLASQDYSTLLSADQTEQNLISSAIGKFASSLGGLGSSGIKLNIGT